MDNEALRLIARLKGSAARMGQSIDVVRFAADRSYARTTMQAFAAAADEDGTLLVLQLMQKLNMTAPVPPPRSAPQAEKSDKSESQPKIVGDTRYIGRLR